MSLGAIYAAATSGQAPATIDGLSIPSDLKTLVTSSWAFAAESRPSMDKCRKALHKLKPHYPTTSDYFSGVPLSWEELPWDRVDKILVLYNPDLDRTLEIETFSTIPIPEYISFTFCSDSEEVAKDYPLQRFPIYYVFPQRGVHGGRCLSKHSVLQYSNYDG